jgi:hypothetical protein|tara:strand:- start:3636 stop:7283 length:3648 start_codon:yes stop_codon:yes gene_type:complete
MIPTNNNTPSPCNPISSNCVIWQGPDISCINLCNGDTVSDVVAALAEKLCEIIDQACACDPDLTGLELKCALPQAGMPDTFVETLQAIIDYMCNITPGSSDVVVVELPPCLRYTDNLGNIVSQLPLTDWADLVNNKICDIINAISIINQNITNLENRVAILESCVLPCTPAQAPDFDIIPQCILPSTTAVPVSTLVLAIEIAFCNLRDVVGTVTEVTSAIAAQCLTPTMSSLSGSGANYGSLPGWIMTPNTLAGSHINQWIAICDLYTAVSDIQQNCCDDSGCDGVDFKYSYILEDSNGDGIPDALKLGFSGSTIPVGYADCGGTTTITVTDAAGQTVSQNAIITTLASSGAYVSIALGTLNVLSSLTVSIPFCVTNGTNQCADTQSLIIPGNVPCPTLIVTQAATDIITSWTSPISAGSTFEIDAVDSLSGVSLGSATINALGGMNTYNHTFAGASPGSTYIISLNIIVNGAITACPPVTITMNGDLCSDLEVTSLSVGAPSPTDRMYLGLYDDGVTVSRYYYDYSTFGFEVIKREDIAGSVPCESVSLTNQSMNTGTGEITVTVTYNDASPVSCELSYSSDGVTYSAPATGADGVRTLATGITSGSVYLKAQQTCTGPIEGLPTIMRYDFNTGTWMVLQSPADCQSSHILAACPSGQEVSRLTLECGLNTYTTPGASAQSWWFYVGKRTVGPGIMRYIYASWDNATSTVRSVVECCACPTFILSDKIQALCGEAGDAVEITFPYVLGGGIPDFTLGPGPVLGGVVQDATQKNKFTYTSAGVATSDNYADTFQVQLQPTIPGTEGCGVYQLTAQVGMVNCGVTLKYTAQPIFAFINTNSFTPTEGGMIKQGLIQLAADWAVDFGYSGSVYFIPMDETNWLGYSQKIVEDGSSYVNPVDPLWDAMKSLPSSWTGGASIYKNAACVIIFSNGSEGVYHDATIAAGFGAGVTAQPTSQYKADYDAHLDMLNGTALSAWAIGQGISSPQFPDGLSTILYPMAVANSAGADTANLLQMMAAYTSETIPAAKYGIKTLPDLTNYLLQGLSPGNPYAGAPTIVGNFTSQLYRTEDGGGATISGMLALLSQEKNNKILNEINTNSNAQFKETLTRAIKSCGDAFTADPLPTSNSYLVEWCKKTSADRYNVTIPGHSCGTLANGTVLKLTNNSGGDYSPPGADVWPDTEEHCFTIIDNCDSTAALGTTTMGTIHVDCDDCLTP